MNFFDKKLTRNRFLTLLLTLYGFVFSFSLFAKTLSYEEAITELNALLNNKNYLTAYQLADFYTYEYGGEAEFDLLTGFAAYGTEQYQEAVFAFERVVLVKPSSYLARYYLALTYQKVDNLHAAITELNKLLNRRLTDAQRNKTQGLLNRVEKQLIERKRTWYQMVSTSLAYDNNINSGSDESEIFIPATGQSIQLFDSSKATADLAYSLSYIAGYQHPLTQDKWLKFDFSANHYGFARHKEFQRQQLGVNFSYVQEILRGQFSASVFSKPLWLEQEVDTDNIGGDAGNVKRETDLYRTENGLSLFFQKNPSRKTGYRVGGNYSVVVNDANPELDFTRMRLSLALQYKTSLLHTLIGHYQEDSSDNPDLAHNDKNSSGITYQLTWPISNSVISNNFVMHESINFDAVHPFFLAIREESLTALTSQMIFNTSKQLQLKLQASFQNRQSNIQLYEYDRFEMSASWQYTF